jgi:hypothetical protein
MKPNGILYVTVPMTWQIHSEPYDFYRFTRYGIQFLCEKSGFDVVSLERMGGFTMYFFLRASAFLNTVLRRTVLAPLFFLGVKSKIRVQLATLALVPFHLIALAMIFLFDRFSPSGARGWVLLAVRRDTAGSPVPAQ